MHYKAGMPENSIYILTGEINTGKTTAIANWANGREDIFGILSPKVWDKRVFQNIETGEQFDMEAIANETDVVKIGRYQFSAKAFDKASSVLQDALQKPKGWLIVDEVGPLELQEKGFYNVMKEIIDGKNNGLKKLFVIRESLVTELISFFQIKNYKILRLPLEIE